MASSSKRAVVSAITVNAALTALKFLATLPAPSAAMMNEAVHSLMDTLNQVFLYLGLVQGERPADRDHAFGHGQKKYLWNLWSAIGLFSIGAGLGLAHAGHAYCALEGSHTAPLMTTLFGVSFDAVWISMAVLGAALLMEGSVLWVAGGEFLRRMRADGYHNPFGYLLKSDDPTLLAVVLEDSVAVSGVLFAAAGIGLTRLTGNPLWDIGFSVLIAVMLGAVAFMLGYLNMRFLTDVRDHEVEQAFAEIAAEHWQVERYHDLRSIIVDESHTVLVAEVELREEAIIPDLYKSVERHRRTLFEQVAGDHRGRANLMRYLETRAAVQATLEQTERIIDQIEAALRSRCPQVYHVTIEVQGLAAPADFDGAASEGLLRSP